MAMPSTDRLARPGSAADVDRPGPFQLVVRCPFQVAAANIMPTELENEIVDAVRVVWPSGAVRVGHGTHIIGLKAGIRG
jgi:hypothetical protein